MLSVLMKENPVKGVPSELWGPLWVRCVAGSLAFIAVTKTIHLIPLTIFQGISNTTPFITGLLACIWLGEKLSIFQIVGMVFCLCGITIITVSNDATPEGSDESEVVSTDRASTISSYHVGIILAIGVVCCFAVGAVTTRRIRAIHFSVI